MCQATSHNVSYAHGASVCFAPDNDRTVHIPAGCKSLSGYEAHNIDSSVVFTWQGRLKTLCAAERTLRREPIQLTFATLSAMSRHSVQRRGDIPVTGTNAGLSSPMD